jgi:hypothetical protein
VCCTDTTFFLLEYPRIDNSPTNARLEDHSN